jgi:EAL domain-containing protein (putative c-di-GMP-specific phosphodiesterase class I)
VKIDQAFIRGLNEGTEDAAITRAIIAMAHGLKLTVVAEGVETDEQLALLEKFGCDMAQGYLLGRPSAQERIGEMLAGAAAAAQ